MRPLVPTPLQPQNSRRKPAEIPFAQLLLPDPTRLDRAGVLPLPRFARGFLQRGEDVQLGDVEGIDSHVAILGLGVRVGVGEDGGDGLADGGSQGEVRGHFALVVEGGFVGLEVEAGEAGLEAPVEEHAVDHARPGEAGVFFADEEIAHGDLAGESGHSLDVAGLRGFAAEFGGDEAFHPCFDRGLDEGQVLGDFGEGR